MNSYLKLWPFLKPHLGLLILAWGCMVFASLLEGVSLWMLVPLLDVVVLNGTLAIPKWLPESLASLVATFQGLPPLARLNLVAGAVLLLFLLKNLVHFGQTYWMSDASLRFLRDIRAGLYRKYQRLSLVFFSGERTGAMVSRITYDVSVIQHAITEGVTDLVYQTARVIVLAALALSIHWKLALLLFLALLPATGFPVYRIGKMLRKLGLLVQERMADLTSQLIEMFQGIRIIQAFTAERKVEERFLKINQEYYKANIKTIKRREALAGGTELIVVAGGLVALQLGGRAVLTGQLTFGTIAAFLAALLSLHQPFKRLSRLNSIHQQALTAAKRVGEVLELVPSVKEEPAAIVLPRFHRQIRFEGVSFRYPPAAPTDQGHREAQAGSLAAHLPEGQLQAGLLDLNRWVLKGIDLTVEKGEVVAIVGPSGCGKTTLVNLIPRFYDPTEGRITIDGTDLRHATLDSLRKQVGLVTQETFLFHDTVRNNIAFGNPKASLEEVIRAARAAHADRFIRALPKGYDSQVGELGSRLSGGERARIAIARALLKDPPFLILDEATSQLDSESEAFVQEALERLMEGRTVFVISHRLSSIRRVDRIVVLEEGQIRQVGRHEELLESSPLYRRLNAYQVAP